MKCTLCNEDKYFRSENLAIAEGWKVTATRGPGGNKYGVFCPNETPEAISEALSEHVDKVWDVVEPGGHTQKKKAKKEEK